MKIIVGLGNIGKDYEKTNHNAGFMILDRIANRLGFKIGNNGFNSEYAVKNFDGEQFVFAKPTTFMNESGIAVKNLMKKFDAKAEDVLVICDDIDQNPGSIRIRKSGSAGTHNGLKSVIAQIGSMDFCRLRIGIGKQAEHQDLADFVLSKMNMTDEQKKGLDKAENAVYDFVVGHFSVDKLMTKYNGEVVVDGKK